MLGIHDVDPINIIMMDVVNTRYKIPHNYYDLCILYNILFINFRFVTFKLEFIFCTLIITFVV